MEESRRIEERIVFMAGISNETAWNYALGMLEVDGLTPSDEMLEMIEMEKRGEITTDEIRERLDKKYNMGGRNKL